ncbi:hypothetical protein SORBI_3001G534400 [Sorghum bicolor]|uniref:Uncharacterized protein n=1 Tax=Sorghum bicolor TaxID=4558 RepID=A0A1Z5SCA8_SORBI|nr:hypothetical protein SORBI_3001G534400 [Sorghum bicolor]
MATCETFQALHVEENDWLRSRDACRHKGKCFNSTPLGGAARCCWSGSGSSYNSTRCRIICAVCDPPSFWHHPLLSLHGLCLYQFVALATRGAFLSGPLICSMLQQSADLLIRM